MISSFVLIGLASLMIFSIAYQGKEIKNDFSDQYFINDYLLKQSESIINHEQVDLDYGLYFNNLGHINQGRTININDSEIVITIGNGRLHYE